MRGHPLTMGQFIIMASYLPDDKEPAMKGHFLWDIKVSIEDRLYCIYGWCRVYVEDSCFLLPLIQLLLLLIFIYCPVIFLFHI